MLEGIASSIAEAVLGQYVEDSAYSKSTVQLGIWSGFVVLENLVLKKSLLDGLKLPITVVHGIVGRVELRIPWSNIGSEPVVAIFDRIYLVVEPKFEWDPNARHAREQAVKQAKLAGAELFAKGSKDDPFQSYREFARTWLIESLVHKLITNIEVHIREVHIRYEDRESCPTEFAVGVTVESIHIQSAHATGPHVDEKAASESDVKSIDASTEQFNAAFPAATTEQPFNIQGTISNKLFIVNHFSVYWNPLRPDGGISTTPSSGSRAGSEAPAKIGANVNPCTCIYSLRSPKEMDNLLSKTIAKRNHSLIDRPRHHFILHPMDLNTSIAFALDLSRSGVQANLSSILMCVMLSTKVDINATISDMQITLEDNQFREMLSLATNMANFTQLEEFSSFRPSVNVHYDPKAWWRYAIFATIHNIRKEGRKAKFQDIASRSRDKMAYTELWKSKLISNNKSTQPSSRDTAAAAAVTTPAAAAGRSPWALSDPATIRLRNPYTRSGALNPSSTAYIEIDQNMYDQTLRLYSHKYSRTTGAEDSGASGVCYFSQPKYRMLYDKLCGTGRRRRQLLQAAEEAAKGTSKAGGKSAAAATSLPVQRFDADMVRLLQEMEEKLSFEDIVYFRSLAEKELSETVSQQSWLAGVVSWALTGSTGGAGAGSVSGAGAGAKRVSEEEQQRLIEALELGAKNGSPPKAKPSANAPIIRMFMQLSRGSVTLCLSTPHEGPSSMSTAMRSSYIPIALPFLAFELEKFNTGVLVFDAGNRLKTFMSLQDFEAYETLTADLEDDKVAIEGRYRRLVSRRTSSSGSAGSMDGVGVHVPPPPPIPGSPGGFPETETSFESGGAHHHPPPPPSPMLIARHKQMKRREELGINEKPSRISVPKGSDSFGRDGSGPNLSKFILAPLLSICVEIAPPTYGYEIGVNVSLDELEILISPSSFWMQSMVTFITWPEDMEYWSEMEMQVMNQVADWKTKFDMKLEHMMNNHADIMLDMHIIAPVIVISESTDLYGTSDSSNAGSSSSSGGGGGGPAVSSPPRVGVKRPGHAPSDVIIIDLGRIVMSTERLAKAEAKRNIMENSAMTVCSASDYGFGGSQALKMSTMSNTGRDGISAHHSTGRDGISAHHSTGRDGISAHHSTGRDGLSAHHSMSPPPIPISAIHPRTPTMSLSSRLDAVKTNVFPPGVAGGIALRRDGFGDEQSVNSSPRESAPIQPEAGVVSKKPLFSEDATGDVYSDVASNPFETDAEPGEATGVPTPIPTPPYSPPHSHGTATPDSSQYHGVLYDLFHVHISQLEVCLVNEFDYKRKTWNVSEKENPDAAHSNLQIAPARLIEKFDIFIEIEVSTLPWDTTLPPIKFTIDLPDLHVQLSDDKFSRLIRFGDAISRNSMSMLQIGKDKADKFADAVERRRRGAVADNLASPMTSSFMNRSGSQGANVVGGGVILSSSRAPSMSSYYSAQNTPVAHRKPRARSIGASSISSRGSGSDRPRSAPRSARRSGANTPTSVKYLSSANLSRARSFLISDGSGGESDSSDDLFFDAKSCLSEDLVVVSPGGTSVVASERRRGRSANKSRRRARSGSYDSLSRLDSRSSVASDASYYRHGRLSASSINNISAISGHRRRSGSGSVRSGMLSSSSSDSDLSDISFVSALEEGSVFRGVHTHTPDLEGLIDESGATPEGLGVAASGFLSPVAVGKSLDERRQDAELEVTRLQQQLQKEEKACAKYMADMRIVQMDAGKKRLLGGLKAALAASEASVRETKERYVEALVTLEGIQHRFARDAATRSGIRKHEDRLEDMFSGEAAYLGGNEINTKKYRPRYTVFKQVPSNRKRQQQLGDRGGVGGNKELIYALVNFPEINIDISASNKNIDGKFVKRTSGGRPTQKNFNKSFIRRSAVFSNAQTDAEVDASYETPMIRIRAAGISMEARHRAMDSKVKVIMREFDIIDLLASSMSTSAAGGNASRVQQKYLISSEPNANSMLMPADHSQPSGAVDVLLIKYEVVFGSNLTDKNKSERFPSQRHRAERRSGRGVDDEETGDEAESDAGSAALEPDALRCAEHTLRMNMGFFEVNIDQNTLSCLLDCVHSTIRAHQANDTYYLPYRKSKGKDKEKEKSPTLQRASSRASMGSVGTEVAQVPESVVIVDARFKLGGFGVALMQNSTPILGVSFWSVQSRVKIDPELAECHLEVTDCSIYQNYPSSSSGSGGAGSLASATVSGVPRYTNKQTIIGRTGAGDIPSLRIDFQVSDFGSLVAVPSATSDSFIDDSRSEYSASPSPLAAIKGRIRTAPLQVTVIPWFVEYLAKEVLCGKVLRSLLQIVAAVERSPEDRESRTGPVRESGTQPPNTAGATATAAPGTPTRVNTMLNSTVLGGGMFDSGSTETTATAGDQSAPSVASTAPAKKSLDEAISRFLAMCNGRVVVDIGTVAITVSNGLNRQLLVPRRGMMPQTHARHSASSGSFAFASLTYNMQSAQAKVTWGSPGVVGVRSRSGRSEMISCSVTIRDTELRINSNLIVDPFESTLRVCLKPSSYIEGSELVGSGDGVPSAQLAVTLSNVTFHVSTYVLLALGQWASQNTGHFTNTLTICDDFITTASDIISPLGDTSVTNSHASVNANSNSNAGTAAPKPAAIAAPIPIQEQLMKALGMNVDMSVLVHEMRLSLDGEEGTSAGGATANANATASVASGGGASTSSSVYGPGAAGAALPVFTHITLEHESAPVRPEFALTCRHIQGSISVNVARAPAAPASLRLRQDIIALKMGVRSVDVVKVAPSGGLLKRLVCTAFERDASTEDSGGVAGAQAHERHAHMEAIHVKASIVGSTGLHADRGAPPVRDECKLSVSASGIHLCSIPEHIADLAGLAQLYLGSFKSASAAAAAASGAGRVNSPTTGSSSMASSPSQFMRRHAQSAPVATALSVGKIAQTGSPGGAPVVASVYSASAAAGAASSNTNFQHASVNPSSVPLSYSAKAQGVGADGRREGGHGDQGGASVGADSSDPTKAAFVLSERTFGMMLGLSAFHTFITVKNCDVWLPLGDGVKAQGSSALPQVPALHLLANISLTGEYEGHATDNPWGTRADYTAYHKRTQRAAAAAAAHGSNHGNDENIDEMSEVPAVSSPPSQFLDDYYDSTNGVFRCERVFHCNSAHLRDITVEWKEIPYPEMFSNVFSAGEGAPREAGAHIHSSSTAVASGKRTAPRAVESSVPGKGSLDQLTELHDSSSQRTIVKPFNVSITHHIKLQATLVPPAGVMFSDLVEQGASRGILSHGGAGANSHRFSGAYSGDMSVGGGGGGVDAPAVAVSPAFTSNDCVRHLVDNGLISVLHDFSVHIPVQQSNCGVEVNLHLNLTPWLGLYQYHLPLLGLAKTLDNSSGGAPGAGAGTTGAGRKGAPLKGTPNRPAPPSPLPSSEPPTPAQAQVQAQVQQGHADAPEPAPEPVDSLLDLALLTARAFTGDLLAATIQVNISAYKVNMYVVNNTNVHAPTPIPLCKLVVENKGTTARVHNASFLNSTALSIASLNCERLESVLQDDNELLVPPSQRFNADSSSSGGSGDGLTHAHGEVYSSGVLTAAGGLVDVPDDMKATVDVAASMLTSVYYVNQQLMVWEPLVEPFRTDYRLFIPHHYPFDDIGDAGVSRAGLQKQLLALRTITSSLGARVSTLEWKWTVPIQSVQFMVQPSSSGAGVSGLAAGAPLHTQTRRSTGGTGMRSSLFELNVDSGEEEEVNVEEEDELQVDIEALGTGTMRGSGAAVTVDPPADRARGRGRGRGILIRRDRATGSVSAGQHDGADQSACSARDAAMICSPLLYMHAATVVNINFTIAFLQMMLSAVPSMGRHLEEVSRRLEAVGQDGCGEGEVNIDGDCAGGGEGGGPHGSSSMAGAMTVSAIPDAGPSTMFTVNNDTGMLLGYWGGEERRWRRQTESIDPLKTSLASLSVSFKMPQECNQQGGSTPAVPNTASAGSAKATGGSFVSPVAVTYGDGMVEPTAAKGFTIRDIGLENRAYRLFKVPYIAAAAALTDSIASNAGLAAIWQEAQRASRRSNPSDILVVAKCDYEDSVKTLRLRSTQKLENNSPLQLLVQLVLQPTPNCQLPLVLTSGVEPKLCVGVKEFASAAVLWECLLKPKAVAYLPVHLCDIPLTRLVVRRERQSKTGIDGRLSGLTTQIPFVHTPAEPKTDIDAYVSLLPPPPFDKLLKAHPYRRSNTMDDSRAASFDVSMDATAAVDMAIAGDSSERMPLSTNGDSLRFRQSRRNLLDLVTYSHWMSFATSAGGGSALNPNPTYINALVTAVGVPHGGSATSSVNADPVNTSTRVSSVDECALRTVSFEAPLVVTNSLGSRVRLELGSRADAGIDGGPGGGLLVLDPGQSSHCMAYHSAQCVHVRLQLLAADEDSANGEPGVTATSGWSTVVAVAGCISESSAPEVTIYTADIVYPNSSILSVLVEARDVGGVRALTVYTPYWIVTASPMVVQYQHDVSVLPGQAQTGTATRVAVLRLNGCDGLSANQSFRLKQGRKGKLAGEADIKRSRKGVSAAMLAYSDRVAQRSGALQDSMSKARGYAGVKLGPEYPIRGLVDILRAPDTTPRSGSTNTLLHGTVGVSGWETPPLTSSTGGGKLSRMNALGNSGHQRATSDGSTTSTLGRDGSGTGTRPVFGGAAATPATGETGSSYKIVHCGYTDSSRGLCRLRLRAGHGTTWSAPFTPDSTSFSFSSSASSVSTTPDFENASKIGLGKPVDLGGGRYEFSLGMVTQMLDPPFHRTAMVVVVDRFTLVNKVDLQTLEIRQFNAGLASSSPLQSFYSLSRSGEADGCTDIATLKPNEESSLWWRPSKQKLLQVRVSGDGWGWSGRFSITQTNQSTSSGVYEVPIRLRNEHDNTVFFLLAQVVHSGPRVSVIFKGGEHVAPYRLENHTLLRFRVRQSCRDESFYRSTVGDSGSGDRVAGNTILLPYHACFYAWDEPLEKLELLLEYQKSSDRDSGSTSWKNLHAASSSSDGGGAGISFSKLQEVELEESGVRGGDPRSKILAVIIADGPVRVLQLHENWGHSMSTNSGGSGSPGSIDRINASVPTAPTPATHINDISLAQSALFRQSVCDFFYRSSLLLHCSVHSVGVSIMDRSPQELLYMSVHNAELIFSFKTAQDHAAANRGSKRPSVSACASAGVQPRSQAGNLEGRDSHRGLADSNSVVFTIQHFQIDSQLWNTPFPCLLYPTTTLTATANAASLQSAGDRDSALGSTTSSAHNSTADLSISRGGSGSHLAGMNSDRPKGRFSSSSSSSANALLLRSTLDSAAHDASSNTPNPNLVPESIASIHSGMLAVLRLSHSDVRSSQQFLQLCASQEFSYAGIMYVKSLKLDIAPFDINLESTILFKLKDFGLSALEELKHLSRALKHEASLRDASASASASASGKGKTGHRSKTSRTAPSPTAVSGFDFSTGTALIPRVDPAPYGHVSVPHLIEDTLSNYVGVGAKRLRLAAPGNKLYLERVDISDMRFNISLNPIKTTDTHERVPIVNRFALALLSVTKMDNVNFKINKLSLSDLYANSGQVVARFESHYRYEAIINIPNVLLSFELFGNPYKFFKSLRRSIQDFIYLPYMGLFTSPFQFLNGLWRGSTSLLRGTIASVLSSVGRIASVGLVSLINSGVVDPVVSLHGVNKTDVTVAPLSTIHTPDPAKRDMGKRAGAARSADLSSAGSTADSLYNAALVYYTHASNVARPKGLLDGFIKGLLDGFYCAVFCYRARGLRGVILASGPMTMGLLGKTSYGFLSIINSYCVNLSYQLLPQVRSGDKYRLIRVRPPRYLPYKSRNEVLRVYSRNENIGQEVIARVSHGKFRVEGYGCHFITATVTRPKSGRAAEMSNVHPLYNNHNNQHHRNSTAQSTTRDMVLFTSVRLVYLVYNLSYYDMLLQVPFKDIITVELRDVNTGAPQVRGDDGEQQFTPDRRLVLDTAGSEASEDPVTPFGSSSEYASTIVSRVSPQSLDFPPAVALFHFADSSSRCAGTGGGTGGTMKPRTPAGGLGSTAAGRGLFSPPRGMAGSSTGPLGSPELGAVGGLGAGASGGLSLVVNYVQFESHIQTARFLQHLLSVMGEASSRGVGAASMHSINSVGRGGPGGAKPAIKDVITQYIVMHINDRAPHHQQHHIRRASSPSRDRSTSRVVTSLSGSSSDIFN